MDLLKDSLKIENWKVEEEDFPVVSEPGPALGLLVPGTVGMLEIVFF